MLAYRSAAMAAALIDSYTPSSGAPAPTSAPAPPAPSPAPAPPAPSRSTSMAVMPGGIAAACCACCGTLGGAMRCCGAGGGGAPPSAAARAKRAASAAAVAAVTAAACAACTAAALPSGPPDWCHESLQVDHRAVAGGSCSGLAVFTSAVSSSGAPSGWKCTARSERLVRSTGRGVPTCTPRPSLPGRQGHMKSLWPVATAITSPAAWKASDAMGRSKSCACRHSPLAASQMRTSWSRLPLAKRRGSCGW
mmetsp:Transcript_53/g.156  ORF Transcript_53/g.156 Transcript_53/m.156 type:complete len:250 (-) Transcript_53:632-1381(-)